MMVSVSMQDAMVAAIAHLYPNACLKLSVVSDNKKSSILFQKDIVSTQNCCRELHARISPQVKHMPGLSFNGNDKNKGTFLYSVGMQCFFC